MPKFMGALSAYNVVPLDGFPNSFDKVWAEKEMIGEILTGMKTWWSSLGSLSIIE